MRHENENMNNDGNNERKTILNLYFDYSYSYSYSSSFSSSAVVWPQKMLFQADRCRIPAKLINFELISCFLPTMAFIHLFWRKYLKWVHFSHHRYILLLWMIDCRNLSSLPYFTLHVCYYVFHCAVSQFDILCFDGHIANNDSLKCLFLLYCLHGKNSPKSHLKLKKKIMHQIMNGLCYFWRE